MAYIPFNYAQLEPRGNELAQGLIKGLQQGQQFNSNALAQQLAQQKIAESRLETDPDALLAYINKLGGTQGYATGQGSNIAQAVINKKLGIPAGYESPDTKRAKDISADLRKDELKTALKELQKIESGLPEQEKLKGELETLITLTKAHPEYFGAGFLGKDFFGESYRKRNLPAGDVDYGKIESLLANILTRQASEFSPRGAVFALSTAKEVKPGFGEAHNIALSKEQQILDSLMSQYSLETKRRNELRKILGYDQVAQNDNDISNMSIAELEAIAGTR